MKDTALTGSAYLHWHRKATAWYKRFAPIHSPDRAEDPKTRTPQVDGGDGVRILLLLLPFLFRDLIAPEVRECIFYVIYQSI